MRPLIILSVTFLALMCFMPFAVTDSSATSTNLSGDVILTEDVKYEDGSTVSIAADTVIDLSVYTMDFGRSSHIITHGTVTVKCITGSLIFGKDTTIDLAGTATLFPTEDLTMTFCGTVTVSKISNGILFGFEPSRSDRNVYFSWGNSFLSLQDPEILYTAEDGGTVIAGFSFAELTDDRYEGDEHISTRTIDITASNTERTVVIDVHRMRAKELNISNTTVTEYYLRTDITSIISLTDVSRLEFHFDSDFIETVTLECDTIISERWKGQELQERTSLYGNVLEIMIDLNILDVIYEIEQHGLDPADLLKSVSFTSICVVMEHKDTDQKMLTDLYVSVDRDRADDWFTAVFKDDGKDYTLTASKPVLSDFSLSRELVVNFSVTVPTIRLTAVEGELTVMEFSAANTKAYVAQLELVPLYHAINMNGELNIQDILDNCVEATLSVDVITFSDHTEDNDIDLTVYDASAVLVKNTKGYNTFTASFNGMDLTAGYGEGVIDAYAERTWLYLESNGSVDECIDALISGIHFTTDSHAEIQMQNAGFTTRYTADGETVNIDSRKISELSPDDVKMNISLDHLMYNDTTTLYGDYSALGYSLNVRAEKEYTDPVGKLDVSLEIDDTYGSFSFTVDDRNRFTLDLCIPWSLDFYYYDIAFQIDADDTGLQLSHGDLEIPYMDIRGMGIISYLSWIPRSDLDLGFRILATVDSLSVYVDEHSKLYNRYTDVELYIRQTDIGLKRGDTLTIETEKLQLSFFNTDGSFIDKKLDHLYIVKDLSDGEKDDPLKKLLPYVTGILFILIGILVVVILYIFIKKPHLTKMNEHENDEQ